MLHLKNLDEGLPVFKALGSEIRINIIKILLEKQQMNMNELATATRNNMALVEVIINNQVLGMVRQWQTLYYEKRYSNTILQDKVDYVKLAEAMGAAGIRVTKKEDLPGAIRKAIDLNTTVLIDCVIDSDDKVFPMVSPGANIEDAFDAEDLKTDN